MEAQQLPAKQPGYFSLREASWLQSPDNPDGLTPLQAMEKVLNEYSLKMMTDPGRERSLVITYLETAIAWETRRMLIKGEAYLET